MIQIIANNGMMTDAGRAYAPFNSCFSRKEIKKLLPDILKNIQTGPGLNVNVSTLQNIKTNDENHLMLVRSAEERGMNLELRVVYPGAMNGEAAKVASVVMNQIYNAISEKDKTFLGGLVFYMQNGSFMSFNDKE